MSYGVTSEGFDRKTFDIILAELMDLARSIMGERVDLSIHNPFYKFLYIIALQKEELWQLAEDVYNSEFISTSTGHTIDMHGEDIGLKRKGATKSEVVVTVLGNCRNSIDIGAKLKTSEGIEFETVEAGQFPSLIAITRDTDNTDTIPSPYSSGSGLTIDWISDNAQGTSLYTESTDYTFDSSTGIIDWSPAGSQPVAGATYYIHLSGTIYINISMRAVLAGETGQVPINSIVEHVSGFNGFVSSTNSAAPTGGEDQESDTNYVKRELNAPRRNWTLDKIRSVVTQDEGVRTSKIYWDSGVDIYQLNEEQEIDNPPDLSQTFNPSDQIGSISKITVKVQRYGSPGNLIGYLYQWHTDHTQTLASPLLCSDIVNQNRISSEEFEELDVDLHFTNIDNTKTYMFHFARPVSANATNFYRFKYTTASDLAGAMYSSGAIVANADLWYKTWYHHASFTTVVVPIESYDTTLVSRLVGEIDSSGKAVAIEKEIRQATERTINVYGELYLDDGYTMSAVTAGIEQRIDTYLDSLDIGDDVTHMDLMWCIAQEPGLKNARQVYMNVDGLDLSIGEDLLVGEYEIAVLGIPGVNFTQEFD